WIWCSTFVTPSHATASPPRRSSDLRLGAHGRLFYRRRQLNLNYKSGNVGDFLRRWGRDYQYMVVLDADSLMGGDTLVRMVQLMRSEEHTSELQSRENLVCRLLLEKK